PSLSAEARTFSATAFPGMREEPLSTREAVARETPASWATSLRRTAGIWSPSSGLSGKRCPDRVSITRRHTGVVGFRRRRPARSRWLGNGTRCSSGGLLAGGDQGAQGVGLAAEHGGVVPGHELEQRIAVRPLRGQDREGALPQRAALGQRQALMGGPPG